MTRQILFIQGGGKDVHDTWDAKLVASLKRALGDGYEVRYPRMPDEAEPNYAKWSATIAREIDALGDGGVVVGHSIGAAIMINALAEGVKARTDEEVFSCEGRSPDSFSRTGPLPPQGNKVALGAIVLVSAPFVGEGGWPGDEFTTPADLGAKLPQGLPVHLYQGLADETATPDHAELYARAISQAEVHRLEGRDHQLNNDLGEVAELVKGLS